jgi:hypothetical protein
MTKNRMLFVVLMVFAQWIICRFEPGGADKG